MDARKDFLMAIDRRRIRSQKARGDFVDQETLHDRVRAADGTLNKGNSLDEILR